MLILVRHAKPAYGPHSPPHTWELDARGRLDATSLRDVLPVDAVLVSSAEPKAHQTLAPSGTVATEPRFGEVTRNEPYEGDFRARRLAYVTGTDHLGWEARSEVIARFDAGVRHWLAKAGDRPLVIATHGMVMTLWLTSIGLTDPGAFWSDLRLPDVFDVSPATGAIRRLPSRARSNAPSRPGADEPHVT